MFKVRDMVYTAVLIAVGVVLPIALHGIPNAGQVLLPMHLPVLLCGLICGVPFGLACGILTPLVSSFLTGMPPAPILPAMVCELAVYGVVAALCGRFIRVRNVYIKIYCSLTAAMLCGRVVFGVINALVFQAGNETYTMQAWLTASFVTALPGITVQLILIPAVVIALNRAKLIRQVS